MNELNRRGGNTDFRLDGAHGSVPCESCHAAGKKYREAKGVCGDCHKSVDVHLGGLGGNCATCHNTDGSGILRDPGAPQLGYMIPPLWGPTSYNDGAGMARLIGDFTAMIGDPSGRSVTRPQLNREQVLVNAETTLPLDSLELWSPASPTLYDLEVSLKDGDTVQSYFGMRKVEMPERLIARLEHGW